MTRVLTLSALVVAGLTSVAWSQATQPAPAPPAQPNPENFTGKVTGHSTADIRTLRYSFEPGARTNWHSHAGGQVILIEGGRMIVQEDGGPIREYGPRQAFTTAPGVKHWHGALPGEPLTQVAVSFGATNWMERVTDAQYSAGRGK
jgi:quercetin dioxygenase-like cupin family protein